MSEIKAWVPTHMFFSDPVMLRFEYPFYRIQYQDNRYAPGVSLDDLNPLPENFVIPEPVDHTWTGEYVEHIPCTLTVQAKNYEEAVEKLEASRRALPHYAKWKGGPTYERSIEEKKTQGIM